jgi:hypothetical protein
MQLVLRPMRQKHVDLTEASVPLHYLRSHHSWATVCVCVRFGGEAEGWLQQQLTMDPWQDNYNVHDDHDAPLNTLEHQGYGLPSRTAAVYRC